MSAREVDINPNKDVGLKLPMARSNKTGDFTTTKNSTQQAVHNISNLLLTSPGERVGQPTFGSNLRALCFEQIDDELPIRIENEVKRSVSQWLSYITINSVETLTQDGDKNQVFVKIKFVPALSSEEQEVLLNVNG